MNSEPSRNLRPRSKPLADAASALACASALLLLGGAGVALAVPAPTTPEDFKLPGTQPLTITESLSTPSSCTPCHSNYGSPEIEPWRSWQGSMLAQAGRDPLMYAAMAIANQDAPNAGELCVRCHMTKGWLEGRSTPPDASATTADDRQGVQCTVCHRMVDPAGGAGAPTEDAAILAALTAPVTSIGGAQVVIDPEERLRGPFDVVGDLGFDPHASARETLISSWHRSSEMCGTCHNVKNPVFQRNMAGDYELGAFDAPGDPELAFPEQQTYDEWAASEYASTPVHAPQFAGAGDGVEGDYTVSTCQDCHMPRVAGRAASFGLVRPAMPVHELVGANTLVPLMIPLHPVFGAEVNATVLAEGAAKALRMLRRAATVEAHIDGGVLTVRVTNETGHKLPTGYPDGRRMWLHVRALDAEGAVVFESGRYDLEQAELVGYEAEPMDPDYDPELQVWETHQGIDPVVAMATGKPAGPSFHLALNSVREFDNRIPPRGFTNAGFEAAFAEPVGKTYAVGQYWDEVTYPVGAAVRAEVELLYQTTTKEYVEFLRDENVTTTDGTIAHDLWEAVDQGPPVEMARVVAVTDTTVVEACRKNVDKTQSKYLKSAMKAWSSCYQSASKGVACNAGATVSAANSAAQKLRERIGGAKDKRCAAEDLTPATLGLGSYCPVPCASVILHDLDDLADCSVCVADSVVAASLGSAWGIVPPAVPDAAPLGAAAECQKNLGDAAVKLGSSWASAGSKCEAANASGKNDPPLDCTADPKIASAQDSAAARVDKCSTFSGLDGCAASAVDPAVVYQCVEDTLAAVMPAWTAVPYPAE